MAAMASVSSSSLPSSTSMNSSHSSEGTSSYVVVEKSLCSENSQLLQSREDGEREIQSKSVSLLEAGSAPQDDLVERVQNLTKENEELKGVLLQNNKLLEEYFQDLASMQKNQKQTNESLRKGYDQAKEAVKKLKEKNACLKTDLKIEQDRNVQLEEQLAKIKDGKPHESSSQLDEQKGSPASQVQTLQDVISRLESEKVTLETNNCKLQEHISCLKAIREAEENIGGDECETLVSLGSLTSPSDEPSVETIQDKYSKLESEKEILQVDLEKLRIESEQSKQDYHQMEEDHNKLLKKLADVEQKQAQAQDDALANSEQVAGLTQQLQVQTEALSTLKEELDNVKQEREVYKKKVEELELIKESTKTERAMTQTEHGVLNQQSETENRDVNKLKEELLNLTQERDSYKMKLDEFQNHLEAAKASAEDAFGKVEDTEMKEKYVKLRDQLWMYQKREAEILARENALYQEKEEAQKQASAEDAFGKVEDTEMKEKYVKLRDQLWMYQKREADILARENALYQEKEEAQKQETAEKEEIERLKQLLHDYEKRNREALETANKQAASHAELTEEIRKLKQQFETERAESRKQVDNLIQERNTYKMKADEFQMQPAAEQGKTGAEEALGGEPDSDLREKFVKVRNQLWIYQGRENDILNRENAVLEKEEVTKQFLKENKKLQQELADALVKVEMLTQERKEQEEEAQLLKRQLSETHEQEVLVLKEELQNKSTDMVAVKTSEEQLKAQVANLRQENQNLVIECEKCKADCTKQEEEAQSLKRQLSETFEHEVEVLKVELQNKSTILEQAQTSEEHLKTQVTQLLQENQAYVIELERLKEDLQQQENMYQDHLHKITQDSEHQRQKRDEMIKNLKTQLSKAEGELQNTRAQHTADKKTLRELQEKHDTTLAEYQEVLRSYDTVLHTNKEQEMERSALHSHLGELTAHLKEADCFGEKLKEDIRIREDELSVLREKTYQLRKLEEQFPILQTQLEVYRADFQVEREAREKQHEEILRLREETQRLQQENQRYQDEMDRLGNEQMVEMQRRHGSFVQEPQQPQQPRGWFDAMPALLFARGGPEMQEGHQISGQGRMGGGAQEQRAEEVEAEGWECPTCRREFPNFDNLQIHAVECNGTQAAPENQCPKCMNVFPDWDTLAIHVEECLEQD